MNLGCANWAETSLQVSAMTGGALAPQGDGPSHLKFDVLADQESKVHDIFEI